MKIKALSAFNCGGPVKVGDEREFSDDVALSLIREKLAELVAEADKPDARAGQKTPDKK